VEASPERLGPDRLRAVRGDERELESRDFHEVVRRD
jgi:hypothetical protein